MSGNKPYTFVIILIIIAVGSFSAGEIQISTSAEGPCIKPNPKPAKFEMDWAMEFGTRAKYVPMASELYYAFTSRFLRGSPIKDVEEINSMCLMIDSKGFSSSISGFGKKNDLECEIKDVGSLLCGAADVMNDESLTDEERNGNATLIVATWTDHKNYLVTINCFPEGLKAWNVVSDLKEIGPEAKKKIFKHVRKFGFDTKLARRANYESC